MKISRKMLWHKDLTKVASRVFGGFVKNHQAPKEATDEQYRTGPAGSQGASASGGGGIHGLLDRLGDRAGLPRLRPRLARSLLDAASYALGLSLAGSARDFGGHNTDIP